MQKRTEITIERETVLFFPGHDQLRQWCAECGEHIAPLTLDEVAAMASVRSWSVLLWMQAGLVHHGETATGLLWICPRSLASVTVGVAL